MECVGCKVNDEDKDVYVRLNKCPICFKMTCDNCCEHAFGRMFCSKRCAHQFFFGDDED